jgi:hypothetical protein
MARFKPCRMERAHRPKIARRMPDRLLTGTFGSHSPAALSELAPHRA